MELEKLKGSLKQVEDPRRTKGGQILHKLEDIIIIGLCTVVCGGEGFPDMEEFGREREEWLGEFLALPHGIPDSDTFRRVFERIKPEALSECLYDWLGYHRIEGSVIAVDGKTIRGSKGDSHKAYHVASAFAAENQLASRKMLRICWLPGKSRTSLVRHVDTQPPSYEAKTSWANVHMVIKVSGLL